MGEGHKDPHPPSDLLEDLKRLFSSKPSWMVQLKFRTGQGLAGLYRHALQPSEREKTFHLSLETPVGRIQESQCLVAMLSSIPGHSPSLMVILLQLLAGGFPLLASVFPSGKLREVEMTNLKGPCWQPYPVKPAFFPLPHALNSLEAGIRPLPLLHVWAFLLL